MTDAEHRAKTKELEKHIAGRRSSVRLISSLQGKIEAKRAIKDLEGVLREHRLNYFDLVSD